MDTINHPSKRIHPLIATAAVALIIVSLTGVAAITGLLPNSHGTSAPVTESLSPLAQLTPDDKLANDVQINPAPAYRAATPAPRHIPVAPLAQVEPRVIPSDPVRSSRSERYNDRPRYSNEHSGYNQPDRAPVRHEPVRVAAVCHSCGRVETVSAIQHEPQQTSGVGVAAGAVLGGLLGNQVGGGNGRTLATVAGAVGGGVAGNEVERRTRHVTTYQVRVRMEDGSVRSFPYNSAPGWNAGDRVEVIDGHLSARG